MSVAFDYVNLRKLQDVKEGEFSAKEASLSESLSALRESAAPLIKDDVEVKESAENFESLAEDLSLMSAKLLEKSTASNDDLDLYLTIHLGFDPSYVSVSSTDSRRYSMLAGVQFKS